MLVQPDVFVVPTEQARALDWSAVHDLLLVAEVLSPSTPRHDRFTKRRRYQEAGVPLYWIVDGDGRQVEVWTPGDAFPRIERDRLALAARRSRRPVHATASGAVPSNRVRPAPCHPERSEGDHMSMAPSLRSW